MGKIFIILLGRVINGVIAFFVIITINTILNGHLYANFSKNIAYLTFLTTFSSGVLSALFLRNGFRLKEGDDGVVLLGGFFLSILSIIPIELSIQFDLFSSLHRIVIYVYVFLSILFSISVSDLQVKQRFYHVIYMDVLKTISPLCVFLYLKTLNFPLITLNQIFLILALGNIFGVIYLMKNVHFSFLQRTMITLYIRQQSKSDLIFGIGLISFNSLSQYITGKDRDFITSIDTKSDSIVAYTADLMTKFINSILFPFNTKISSELGSIYNQGETEKMYNKINLYSIITLFLGMVITLCIYLVYILFSYLQIFKSFDGNSIIFYGLANTLLLSTSIYQKKFDYGNYKLLPAFLLLFSFFIASILRYFVFYIHNFLLVTISIYCVLILLTNFVVFKLKSI